MRIILDGGFDSGRLLVGNIDGSSFRLVIARTALTTE